MYIYTYLYIYIYTYIYIYDEKKLGSDVGLSVVLTQGWILYTLIIVNRQWTTPSERCIKLAQGQIHSSWSESKPYQEATPNRDTQFKNS